MAIDFRPITNTGTNTGINTGSKLSGSKTRSKIDFRPVANPEESPGFFRSLGEALISSEKGFGESLAAAMPDYITGRDLIEESRLQEDQTKNKLVTLLHQARAKGQDTTKIMNIMRQQGIPDDEQLYPALKKTTKQRIGEAAGV